MNCPYCDGKNVRYVGIEEGGDYGEMLVDLWICNDCDHEFERGGILNRELFDEPIEREDSDNVTASGSEK